MHRIRRHIRGDAERGAAGAFVRPLDVCTTQRGGYATKRVLSARRQGALRGVEGEELLDGVRATPRRRHASSFATRPWRSAQRREGRVARLHVIESPAEDGLLARAADDARLRVAQLGSATMSGRRYNLRQKLKEDRVVAARRALLGAFRVWGCGGRIGGGRRGRRTGRGDAEVAVEPRVPEASTIVLHAHLQEVGGGRLGVGLQAGAGGIGVRADDHEPVAGAVFGADGVRAHRAHVASEEVLPPALEVVPRVTLGDFLPCGKKKRGQG